MDYDNDSDEEVKQYFDVALTFVFAILSRFVVASVRYGQTQ